MKLLCSIIILFLALTSKLNGQSQFIFQTPINIEICDSLSEKLKEIVINILNTEVVLEYNDLEIKFTFPLTDEDFDFDKEELTKQILAEIRQNLFPNIQIIRQTSTHERIEIEDSESPEENPTIRIKIEPRN